MASDFCNANFNRLFLKNKRVVSRLVQNFKKIDLYLLIKSCVQPFNCHAAIAQSAVPEAIATEAWLGWLLRNVKDERYSINGTGGSSLTRRMGKLAINAVTL